MPPGAGFGLPQHPGPGAQYGMDRYVVCLVQPETNSAEEKKVGQSDLKTRFLVCSRRAKMFAVVALRNHLQHALKSALGVFLGSATDYCRGFDVAPSLSSSPLVVM